MPTQVNSLFLLEDLEDVGKTSELAEADLEALQAVADWLETFVVKPHKDLGRAGTVCPFVPGSLERKTLWLAPEQIADRDAREVVELMSGYKKLLLDTRPTEGDDVSYNVIVGATGVASLLYINALELVMGGGLFRIPWQGVALYGVAANLCYTGGWIAENLVERWLRRPTYGLGPALFRHGLVFSIGLTLIPAIVVTIANIAGRLFAP